jgi:pimeloyl-ACP methyl ester carboxylesterase
MKRCLAAIAAAAALAACASTPAIKDGQGKPLAGSVAYLGYVELGGLPQFVCARGRSADNPVLLYLHGGPGSAETAFMRHFDAALEEDFIVVNWDQRGAGKSYSKDIPLASMNVDQFVSDTHELVAWLKAKFGKQKIYLAGHSWGTILGVRTVRKYPEDFLAYVGVNQYVDAAENERISYEYTLAEARKRNNAKAVKELEAIGAPVAGRYQRPLEDMLIQRKWLGEFGGAMHTKVDYVAAVLAASEYRDKGPLFLASMDAAKFSVAAMQSELLKTDLLADATEFGVPVYFFVGRYDYNTPFVLAERYFERLAAPAKTLVWFDESAHLIPFEEPAAFRRALLRVRAETAPTTAAIGTAAS